MLEVIGQHAAAGRLTLDEHEERASLVLAAKTRDDLAAVTRDLPDVNQPSPVAQPAVAAAPAQRPKTNRWFVAMMGGSQ